MLLPSDVARLVLGYLQEEGLSATSRAFIHESPNLKEYAEHSTEDGTIPACVFSIFGKGLTTILNEYVAGKTKESNPQVPAIMTSLWKKLDFTLNQIKSLQNSPALSACQRVRTRVGLANMARQRALATPTTGVVCTAVSETFSIISPAQTSHSMLTHSTPVSYSSPHCRLTLSSAPHLQSQEGSRLLNTPRESPVNASEIRLNPGSMSPGRRKWKRSGALSGASVTSRPVPTSGLAPEQEPEEIVDENFPQLVIQNARDKILGDRSLQEKLAENINKILASEPTPQLSKASTNMVEPDQSIDEILGLQGEIHMSDDAIHDILEQTESDPAFQALFDLFDCNKTRSTDGEPADGDISSSPDEIDLPGPSSVVRPSQSVDSGPTQREAPDPVSLKAKAGLDRKTRKSAPLLKKTVIGPSDRTSRIENSSAKLLVMHSSQGTSSTKRKEKSPHVNNVTPMDIDEPQATVASAPTNISTTNAATTSVATDLNIISPSQFTIASMVSEAANLNKQHENKETQRSQEQPAPTPTSNVNKKDSPSSTAQPIVSNPPSLAEHTSNSGKDTQQFPTYLITSATSSAAHTTVTSPIPPSVSNVASTSSASPVSVSTSSSLTTASASSISSSSLTTSTVESNASNKAGTDSGNIVSLKIIISDNQEENSSTDPALSQAISSISGDKIPTIYLSSPAKSPAAPSTPKANLDEAAQAVSCLQRSESVIASPLSGTSQTQQSYIIQLPFDGATTTPGSYFLLTEPPTTDAQATQTVVPASAAVSKGQPIAPKHFGVTPQKQGFSAGSTLILPSPMKSVVLPLSVMGQNTLGNVQMVPNQIVAIPNPPVVQHLETVKPMPTGAVSLSTTAGPEQNVSAKVVPSLAPNPGIQNISASPTPGHRRILCFDSSADSQTGKITTSPAASASATQSVPPPASRTKPAILSGNKPKRRIEPVRCSEAEKTTTSPQNQKDAAKKGLRKQDYSICNKESSSASITDISKPSESGRRSKSTDRKHNHDMDDRAKVNDSHISRSGSLDSSQKSGSRREKEATDKAKTREGRTEKRTQEITRVTANKENELKGSIQEQQLPTPSSAPVQSTNQSKTSKPPSKTSSLAKQAAEMLQDIQGLTSPSTPKGTDHSSQEESGGDCPRTPTRQRKSRDGEGTPRHLMPPNSSDVPTCSPASEAGSESSINMAAHTLMILSRAAIARTGTPLKDSLRQEGVGEQQSPTTSKNTKKRKQSSPASSPPAKKESKRTPSKKKERKKLVECFPHDLDVDKFLSSLHYDE